MRYNSPKEEAWWHCMKVNESSWIPDFQISTTNRDIVFKLSSHINSSWWRHSTLIIFAFLKFAFYSFFTLLRSLAKNGQCLSHFSAKNLKWTYFGHWSAALDGPPFESWLVMGNLQSPENILLFQTFLKKIEQMKKCWKPFRNKNF